MFGHERNNTGDGFGTGGVKSSETTSINLTPVRDEPTITPKLSAEERTAVEALPGGGYTPLHHPFTAPHKDDVARLLELVGDFDRSSPEGSWRLYSAALRSRAYDAVYNGNELASGSVRIHDAALQRMIFRAIGLDAEEAARKFGFLLEAFRYGAPPHAGFAFGFDRLVLDFSGSMNYDSQLTSSLGLCAAEDLVDNMWNELVEANPKWPGTSTSKFPAGGFGLPFSSSIGYEGQTATNNTWVCFARQFSFTDLDVYARHLRGIRRADADQLRSAIGQDGAGS